MPFSVPQLVIGLVGLMLLTCGALSVSRSRMTLAMSLAGIALLCLDELMILGWVQLL